MQAETGFYTLPGGHSSFILERIVHDEAIVERIAKQTSRKITDEVIKVLEPYLPSLDKRRTSSRSRRKYGPFTRKPAAKKAREAYRAYRDTDCTQNKAMETAGCTRQSFNNLLDWLDKGGQLEELDKALGGS